MILIMIYIKFGHMIESICHMGIKFKYLFTGIFCDKMAKDENERSLEDEIEMLDKADGQKPKDEKERNFPDELEFLDGDNEEEGHYEDTPLATHIEQKEREPEGPAGKTKVQYNAGSYKIIIPKDVVRQTNLDKGDVIHWTVTDTDKLKATIFKVGERIPVDERQR